MTVPSIARSEAGSSTSSWILSRSRWWPNVSRSPSSSGRRSRTSPAYAHVYPLEREQLDRIAFFFDCDFLQAKEKGAAYSTLSQVVEDCRRRIPTRIC